VESINGATGVCADLPLQSSFPKGLARGENRGGDDRDLRWKCVDESDGEKQDKDRYDCDKKNFDLRGEGHKMFKQIFI
jgi:hypothetical protein